MMGSSSSCREHVETGYLARQASGGVESLRAIPWIFAWTQNRLVLPAWLGVGEALVEAFQQAASPPAAWSQSQLEIQRSKLHSLRSCRAVHVR